MVGEHLAAFARRAVAKPAGERTAPSARQGIDDRLRCLGAGCDGGRAIEDQDHRSVVLEQDVESLGVTFRLERRR